MSDRRDRSNRLRRRLDDEPEADSASEDGDAPADSQASNSSVSGKRSNPSSPSKSDMPSKTEGETVSVKDRPSVLMYLPEALRQELDIRFDELNAQYKRAHGESLEKNRDWYPVLVALALEKAEEMPDEELLERFSADDY